MSLNPRMVLSKKGEAFTEKQEGVVNYVYDDSKYPTRRWSKDQKVGGHLTAGVGHLLTQGEIGRWTGKDIPKAQIDLWFDRDNDDAEKAVNDLVVVPLKQNQFDVLTDFVFNNNRNAFANSTLLKRVNRGEFTKVPAELIKWDKTHINGKLVTSPGLQKRCADRVAYWNSANTDIALADPSIPTGTNIATPGPQPTSPYEWATLGITGVSGLGSFAGVSGFFGVALGIVLLGAFVVGAGIIIKRVWFNK